VRLGGEIHHGVDLVVGEQAGDEVGVADVSLREDVARIVREVGEIGGVTGVGEQVEVDDLAERRAGLGEALTNEIAADEAAAASDEEIHGIRIGASSWREPVGRIRGLR